MKFIYSSIKDLTEAFVGDEKKFNTPVLVEVEGGYMAFKALANYEIWNNKRLSSFLPIQNTKVMIITRDRSKKTYDPFSKMITRATGNFTQNIISQLACPDPE